MSDGALRLIASAVAALLGLSACSGTDHPGAAPTTGPVEPEPVEPEPVMSDAVEPEPVESVDRSESGRLEPLWRDRPPLRVMFDGADVASLEMGLQEWDDLAEDPPEPDPSTGAVADVGQTITFVPVHPAELTIVLYQLGSGTTFEKAGTIAGADSEISLAVPEAGIWLLDIAATFGPSDRYQGSGVLRSALWLHAAPRGTGCSVPRAELEELSGVVDGDGCPAPGDVIRLQLALALPWFHCAPWPPTLEWASHPTSDSAEFLRYQHGDIWPTVVTMPDDARPSGFELAAGPILTAPSDPAAVFVGIGDGDAERWLPPNYEAGCD